MSMTTTTIRLAVTMLTLGFAACGHTANAPTPDQGIRAMNSYVAIFEIPATDMSRAIHFYQNVLNLKIEKMELPGMEMGLLPFEDQAVIGVLMKGEGYEPSASGVTLYLNGGHDLQIVLERVEKNGGKVLVPKSPHADESGFFAIFLDSEGNKLGLHSEN